jgi:signal transduction histidine kinase/CheY-like chemotaxis protein
MDTPRYKELTERYYTVADEKGKLDTLVDMGIEVRNFDVEHASQIADEIIVRAQSISYIHAQGRGLNLKGSCCWLQGDYEKGLEVLQQAYEIAQKTKERQLEARVLNNFGNIHRDLGDLANALNYFAKALRINEELEDEFSQSVNLTSISNLHYDLNDYDSALEYALKCLPIFERSRDINPLLTLYNTLGNIYFKQDKYGEALRYFEEILNHSEPETVPYVMAESGLGKVYYKMQDFANALKYLTLALKQSQQLSNAEVQIITNFYIGRWYMDEGDYRQALQYLNVAYSLANEYQRRHDLMSVHEMLSALYDKMGDIPKAFHHLKTFEELKEEIFQQTTLNKLRNLQIRQQTELAQKEKEVAEKTAFLKQQFMANMSHEIRTPMNAIVGMARLLMSKEPKQEQLRYLHAIQQSADNLLVIINDILDLSKIEAGKIIIENTPFALGEVVQSVSDMLMLKAEEKNIALKVSIAPDIPRKLSGDPTRLNQVLINLAGNAVKFTEKGFVEVKATCHKKDGKTIWIQFDVTDTGIGISPDYVDKIFDSFTQAGSDVARKFGGTGLGLTISKQLVGLMQGEISVKSQLNEGTTFTVIIPFQEAAVQEDDNKDAVLDATSMQRLNKMKILLVEDNEFNRMVAEDTLKELIPNISIDIAVNGQEAVNRLQCENYDIVLMDIQMPVMDGVTATKTIRNTLPAPAKNVKIIAMTANVLQEDVQQYFAVGMDAYVSKPFQTDELLLKMDAVMKNKPLTQTDHMPNLITVEPEPINEQVTDMLFLDKFASGNSDKMQKYIGMFLDNAPRLLASIDAAMPLKDYAAIKIAAHSLKPQLSYMGVKEEVSHIFLIEQSAGEAAQYNSLPQLITNLKRVCEKAFEELRKKQ